MHCLYLRKSRADLELEAKGELETLARHRKTLLDLAKRNKLNITQIYEEIVSGETIEARPVVRQLLDEVEQGKWNGVLVMEVERLARGDTIDQGIVARAFKLGHAKIITPAKVYDPDNEFDEEYFEFGLFMSRREYKTINRRIQRGRVASAKEGKFLGSTPPYGYDKVRISGDKGYTLSPNEEEAPTVKLIYNMYTQGSGMSVIARQLDLMGIKPRYRDTWSKSTISDILANPVYTGMLRWSYRVDQKYIEDGKLKKRRSVNDNPILVDGLHPAIISSEVFDMAQDVRSKNTHKKTKSGLTLQNPLSGLVYCRQCDQLMTRLGPNKRNDYDTLICPNRYCNTVSAPIFLVEKKILQTLKEWLETYRLTLQNQRTGQDDTEILTQQKTLKSLKQEIERIEVQISKTYDLLEQGIYTTELFTMRNTELAERKEKAAEQAEKIEHRISHMEVAKKTELQRIPHMIQMLDAYSSSEDAKRKNAVLRELLNRVEYLKTVPNTRGNLTNDNFEIHVFPRLSD